MERSERFRLFVRELISSDPASSIDEAFMLLALTLNGVEDRFSGTPFRPENWMRDGRMYPPQEDSELTRRHPSVRTFMSRGHYIHFAANGAIKIVSKGASGEVVVDKPGSDGLAAPL